MLTRQFTQKWQFCDHLIKLMSFQLSSVEQEECILKKVSTAYNEKTPLAFIVRTKTNIWKNMFMFHRRKSDIQIGMTSKMFSFLDDLSL